MHGMDLESEFEFECNSYIIDLFWMIRFKLLVDVIYCSKFAAHPTFKPSNRLQKIRLALPPWAVESSLRRARVRQT